MCFKTMKEAEEAADTLHKKLVTCKNHISIIDEGKKGFHICVYLYNPENSEYLAQILVDSGFECKLSKEKFTLGKSNSTDKLIVRSKSGVDLLAGLVSDPALVSKACDTGVLQG